MKIKIRAMWTKSIYDDFYKTGHNFILRMISFPITNDIHASEDIIEEAIIKSFKVKFANIGHLMEWMKPTVKHDSINFVRSTYKKRVIHVFECDSQDAYEDVSFEKKIRKEFVKKLIDGLSPRASLIIRLLYLEQMSIKEVSEALNIHPSGVKTQTQRSLNILREKLGTTKEKFTENVNILCEKIKKSTQGHRGTGNLYGVSEEAVYAIKNGYNRSIHINHI